MADRNSYSVAMAVLVGSDLAQVMFLVSYKPFDIVSRWIITFKVLHDTTICFVDRAFLFM